MLHIPEVSRPRSPISPAPRDLPWHTIDEVTSKPPQAIFLAQDGCFIGFFLKIGAAETAI
jgi:hypothetical protein